MNSIIYDILSRSRLAIAALLISTAGSVTFAQEARNPPVGQSSTQAPESAGQVAIAKEAPFLAENEAAMNKMMADMSVKPSGDINRDFVAMMAPHHQGAIDMAQALLRYGSNEQLKRLAQEIIVTQQQEIAAMRLAIGDQLPPSAPSPTRPTPEPTTAQQSAPADAMPVSTDQMKKK